MPTILILAMAALSVTAAAPGRQMNAIASLPPPPVWLESLYGPAETIPSGMPTDCHAVLHSNDWINGTVYSIVRFGGASVYSDSEHFELDPGESLLVDSGWWLYDSGYYEVKDSAVCESHPDSAYQVVWDFLIGPRHHGGIGIARMIHIPDYFADTFWGQTPEFELANYGPAADSGWAFVLFTDTIQDRIVHLDSVWFSLDQGEYQDVTFQSFRFHALGPHVGVCGWKTFGGDTDSLSWRFTVRSHQQGAVGISRVIGVPFDTVDTFTTWEPQVVLRNYGTTPESVCVALMFSDTFDDRVVYADTHRVLLERSVGVQFRPFRFTVPGPYQGLVALLPESDSIAWDFWVSGALGIEELPAGVAQRNTATVVRGVLFLNGDCPRTGTVPKADLLDIAGRKVASLLPGPNDVSHIAPGVYFVRTVNGEGRLANKVAVQR